MSALICDYNVITPYGPGNEALWDGLTSGKAAVKDCNRFNTQHFLSNKAALVDVIDSTSKESVSMQLIRLLFDHSGLKVPTDAYIIAATTIGEIDLLERAVLNKSGDVEESRISNLSTSVATILGTERGGMVISSACASSTAALLRALSLLESGREECVLVVGVDAVSEFVYSGFSSLMALDKNFARPFDKDRAGLNVGEGAAYMLLMTEERAAREGITSRGILAGAGMTNDANHMTGPSRDGSGLSRAIKKAITSSRTNKKSIGFIAAHGTGTEYNDSMEMKAFKRVFAEPIPVFSIKGAIGHTMGSCGLIQSSVALSAMAKNRVPMTVGLRDVCDEADGWASSETQKIRRSACIVANAGFGGTNAAVVIKKC